MWQDKWVTVVLIVLLGLLQYRLWSGKNSLPDYLALKQEVQQQSLQNDNLAQRNNLLKADISDLKIGLESIEERARNELGLIKQGETFYRILPADNEQSMSHPSVVAVVPAAGVGSRMQADRPKQYLRLGEKTILEHTLSALHAHPKISHIVVAVSAGDPFFPELPVASAPWLTVVDGGAERADSVFAALSQLNDNDWALVHDAARPCVSLTDIDTLLQVRERDDVAGGILATPVKDTMKREMASKNNIVSHTECREQLWHALTPQLFRAGELRQALIQAQEKNIPVTDEASAMEAAGHKVALIDSNPANIKITRPADMPLAAFYLQQTQTL